MPDPIALNIRGLIEELARPLLQLAPHEPIPWDERFDTLGIDSLGAVDLVDEVATRTGVSLPAATLLELRTLGDVAEYLARESSTSIAS